MAYKFNGFVIADIITLLVAIALLVILIVVLTRNNLTDTTCTGDDAANGCAQAKITKLDNKVNWLYALEIAGVGLMILAGVLAFFRVRSWVC